MGDVTEQSLCLTCTVFSTVTSRWLLELQDISNPFMIQGHRIIDQKVLPLSEADLPACLGARDLVSGDPSSLEVGARV